MNNGWVRGVPTLPNLPNAVSNDLWISGPLTGNSEPSITIITLITIIIIIIMDIDNGNRILVL